MFLIFQFHDCLQMKDRAKVVLEEAIYLGNFIPPHFTAFLITPEIEKKEIENQIIKLHNTPHLSCSTSENKSFHYGVAYVTLNIDKIKKHVICIAGEFSTKYYGN